MLCRRLLLALFAPLVGALPVSAQEVRSAPGIAVGPGHRVAITLGARDGARGGLKAGEDLVVTLAYSDPSSGRAVEGLAPRAWLRRLRAEGGSSCTNAAWAVRATGAIAPDDVPLERSFVLALGEGEDRLSVVDPAHRMRGANLVSLTPLGGRIASLVLHPGAATALASRPKSGDVLAVRLPWGGAAPFATGLDRPGALVPVGSDVLVLERPDAPRLVRFDGSGTRRAAYEIGPGPVRITSAGADRVVALASDGSALLLEADLPPKRLPPATLSAAMAAGGGVLATAGPDATLSVRWLDAPDRVQAVSLPFVPDGIFVRPDGMVALAWSQVAREAVPVDVARLRAFTPIALPGPIDEVVSAGPALVVTFRATPQAAVIDLTPTGSGRDPVTRLVSVPAGADQQGEGRLVGSDRMASALTIRPGSDVVVTIPAGGGLSGQPMSILTIRGDRPRSILLFEQRPKQVAPGRFTAPVRLPFGGSWEVLTTTGPGGTTACATFMIEGQEPAEARTASLRLLSGPVRAGTPSRLIFAIDNRPDWLAPGPVAIQVQDLGYSSSRRIVATLSAQSELSAELTFPDAGHYAVFLERGGERVAPSVVAVQP